MSARHLIPDSDLGSLYEARLPKAPKFATLNDEQKAEIRLYFESRGILWNPRWGLTGRLSAYGALRGFTLAEETDTEEDTDEEDSEEKEADKKEDKPEEKEEPKKEDDDEEIEGEGDSTGTSVSVDDDDDDEVEGAIPPREDEKSLHVELNRLKDAWNQQPDKRGQILARAKKLLTPTAQAVIRTTLKRKLSPDDVDDLVSKTFEVWIEKLKSGQYSFSKPEDNQVAVITGTAGNVARTWGRDQAIHNRIAPTGSLEEPLGSGEEAKHVSDIVPDVGPNPRQAADRSERGQKAAKFAQDLKHVLSRKTDPARRQDVMTVFDAMLNAKSGNPREISDELTRTTGRPWSKHEVIRAMRHIQLTISANDDPVIRVAKKFLRTTEGAVFLQEHPHFKFIFEGLFTVPVDSTHAIEQFSRFSIL